MLNLNSFMIGTGKHKEMVAFYKKILGKDPDMKEEGWAGWMVGKSFFAVGAHSEVKGKSKEPARLMFVLETPEVDKEYKRMVKEGAKAIKAPYEMEKMLIATLEDPDGNYFQLMSPWKEEK